MSGPERAPYPEVEAQPSFPAIEGEVLRRWADEGTFRASIEQRPAGEDGANEYVFYDGPPFANGLPHYGHLLTSYVKDAVPRYQTMRGRRVERRFGWDCHGLPAEMGVEKELGVSGHVAIEELGIARFNDACRRSVLQYTQEWERYITRMARWVDFDDDYKTMDLPYMESVLWAFKQLWTKGLVYEGYKVLPYCWECETPLSNHETRLDDAYRDRQDPAVTVLFDLHVDEGQTPERILVWTTTPWTLPSNLALAVGEDIEYAVLEEGGVRYLVGEGTLAKYEKELSSAARVATVKGAELVGRTYAPLFPWFAGHQNAFRVLAAEFVNTDEGTGTVHIAPGFGEDDQRLCEEQGIAVVCPVDERGRYTSEVEAWAGTQVFDANPEIVKELKARGALVRHDSYVHAYPHCWRSDTPLIYKAVSSWFVDVQSVKQRALELNQEIDWVPERIRDGAFGSWLRDARDWSISRNRFWGAPIPVWRSDDPAYPRVDVYGSLDEIEADFGVRPDDLHRPAIDELTRPNPDDPTGASTMRRVEEVLDCWFESGSMPYAQVHYPFENREWFDAHFPADFIVEYVGQTKAWFYNMHILSTALFDKPPFRRAVVHGVLLGADGRKMSKRLRNYPDPEEVFNDLGADAMRWFLLSSAVLRGQDLIVERKGIVEVVRQVLNPLWNTWRLFSMNANANGVRASLGATGSANVLDRYVLAKTRVLVDDVTDRMEVADLFGACAAVVTYLDALTNWYVRRSRDRFWEGDQDAFDTLATVLHTVARLVAPLLPLLSDKLWSGLTAGAESEPASVHLADWPAPDSLPADDALVEAMDLARAACSAAHSVRKEQRLRARLPLPAVTVAAPGAEDMAPFAGLLRDELNVKDVRLTTDVASFGDEVLAVSPAVLGPRLGPDTQKVIRAVKAGDWEVRADGTARAGGFGLHEGEFTLKLTPRDPDVSRALEGRTGLVVLDTAVTPELEQEGLARDVVRLVQEARKDADLNITDRIRLSLSAPDDVRDAVEAHRTYVMDQTLSVELHNGVDLSEGHRAELTDGRALTIAVTPIPT